MIAQASPPILELHRTQLKFHLSKALYRGFIGGRGSGKSWIGAFDLVARAKSGRTYLVAAPTYPMLTDSSLRSFLTIARMLGVLDINQLKKAPPPACRLLTGAEILFRSADDPERLRGPNLSGVWLDEASLIDKDAFDIAIACLREQGEQGWMSITATPKGLSHWTYEYFGKERPDTELFRARTSDNPFNPPEFAATLERQYGAGAFARQELEGEFVEDDDAWQVIPTAWVRAAQARWTEKPPEGQALTAIGVDVAHGGCFDDQTEILTNEGWKLFENLTGAEKVLTLNGDVAEWGPITCLHKYRFDGELNLYDGCRVNFCITDNHNLVVRSHPKSNEYVIRRFDQLPKVFVLKRTNCWNGSNPDFVEFESVVTMPYGGERRKQWRFSFSDWAEFLGWFVSEGYVFKEKRRGKWRIGIAQKTGVKLDEIKALLDRMGILYHCCQDGGRARGIIFNNNAIGQHLAEHCGQGARNKRVPRYLKDASTAAIESFLHAYGLGDGFMSNKGTRSFTSTSRLLIDDVQEMLVKIGRGGKMTVRKEQAVGTVASLGYRSFRRKVQGYIVVERQYSVDSEILRKKISRVPYSGFVYCVSTPYRTIMVRRKGCAMWSGNSDRTVVSARYGNWFAPLKKYQGVATDSGEKAAHLVMREMPKDSDALVNVDAIGYGAACHEELRKLIGERAVAVNVATAPTTDIFDRTRKYKMRNTRSALHWKLREALDPVNGDNLMLPPDPELLAELSAPRFDVTASGIQIEKKDDIKKRTKRSPDCAEAVMLAHMQFKRKFSVFV